MDRFFFLGLIVLIPIGASAVEIYDRFPDMMDCQDQSLTAPKQWIHH